MTFPVLDVLTVATWAFLPGVALVLGRDRLRRAGSSAVGPTALATSLAGVVLVAAALAPSLGARAEQSFAPHMAQHLALGLFGPLLLVVGRSSELLAWVASPPLRRRIQRPAAWLQSGRRSTLVPALVFVGTWYLWHLPALYGAAVTVPLAHAAEHLSLLGAGWWFWTTVAPQRRRTGTVVLALFSVSLALGFLGALLSLSPVPFYEPHVAATTPTAALDDQRLGGLVMWTPGGLTLLVAGVAQLVRWLDIDGTGERPRARASVGRFQS